MTSKLISAMLETPLCTKEDMAKHLNIPESQIIDLIHSGCFQTFGTHSQLLRVADVLQFLYPHQWFQILGMNHVHTIQKQLRDVVFEMLEIKKGNLSGATLDDYYNSAKHICEFFDKNFITDIKPRDIELFYQSLKNKRTGKPLSNHSVKGIRKILNMTLHYAYLNGYIEKPFPITSVKMKAGYITKKDSRFLSKEDVSKLFQIVEGHPRYYILCRILLVTGLRIGEALALQFSDFDRKEGIVHIRHSLKKGDVKHDYKYVREHIIGLPKTEAGCRDIPLPLDIFTTIENWRCYLKRQDKHFQKCVENGTDNFLFTNYKGEFLQYHTLQYNFQNYLRRNKECALPRITFHMLRHTFGSLLLEQGAELSIVSKLLGHSSIKITSDIYITITKELKQETLKTFEKTLQHIDNINYKR